MVYTGVPHTRVYTSVLGRNQGGIHLRLWENQGGLFPGFLSERWFIPGFPLRKVLKGGPGPWGERRERTLRREEPVSLKVSLSLRRVYTLV